MAWTVEKLKKFKETGSMYNVPQKTLSLEDRQKAIGIIGTPELDTSSVSWNDNPPIANVNIPGFNVNLNPEPVNVPQLMNRNYVPDELKKVGSKVAETIGNIPLNPATYAENKILDLVTGSNKASDELKVKDLGRLSNAAISLGEKSDNAIDYLKNNVQPTQYAGSFKLPSTTPNLDFATYNKEQTQNKLKNSAEALKGKYEPNPLRLGMSEQQATQFEKDNPTLATIGKFGISAVVDPLNFVGLDLIDSLAKGSKVAKTGSKFADDIVELGVKELADKEKYLAEKMPGIQNYIDTAGKKPKSLNIEPKTIGDINTIQPNEKLPKSQIKPLNNIDSIDKKSSYSVGDKKVKSYQYEHPEVKDHYQTYANYILKNEFVPAKSGYSGEIERSLQGPVMKKLKAEVGNYNDIKKGLEGIIKDQGSENIAASKRVELVLDDMLSNGFKSIDGKDLPADVDYLKIKSKIEGKEIKPNESLLPDYAPTTERNILTNETGGIKNIFGAERSTEKLNNVESATQSLIQEGSKTKKSIKGTFEDLYTKFINKDYTLGKKEVKSAFGEGLQMKAANTSNNKGIVEYVMRDKLVDKNGVPVGNSLKSVIDNIPQKSQTAFEDYLLHKHNIPRTENGKPIFVKDANGVEVTPEYSKAKIAEYEAANPQFQKWSQDLNKWLNDFMQTWGVDTGLISQDKYNMLREMYPDYVPTYRILDEVEQGGKSLGKSGQYVNNPNVLKKAKGSSKPVQSPLQNIMELANKTIRTAKNNEVGQYIIDAIKANPEDTKAFATIVEEPKTGIDNLSMVEGEDGLEGVIDNLDKQFANVDKSKPNVVRVMINGEPTYIKITDKDFLDVITGLSKGATEFEAAGRKSTGWLKSLITQNNPIFMVKNVIRDLPTAYANGSELNPVKFLLDLKSASKEMSTNGKIWQEYKGLGGGGGGFFSVDKSLDRNLYGNAWDRAKSLIEKGNSTTEQLPRFAEYMKIVKKYGNTPEAKMRGLFAANDLTVNFARKGSSDIIRGLDGWTMFLNAGIQGLDKLKRQLMTKPFSTLGKGGFVVATPTLATYLINKDNPYYQQLDNRTKDTYFNIPNYLDTDENGYPKTFIKIPKTREYGAIFGALFERGLRQAFGEKNSYKGIGNTIANNFSPANPLTDNIFAPIVNLRANKDFADRAIVPQSLQSRSPELQYDEKTSELSKVASKGIVNSLGKVWDKLNMSPKQIDYLLKSYSGIVGQLAMPIMQNKSNAVSMPTDVLKSNFIADPLYSNQLNTDFYDNKKSLETKRADYKALNPNDKKDYKDKTLTLFNKTSESISKLYDQINKLDPVKDKSKIQEIRSKINQLYNNANKQIKP